MYHLSARDKQNRNYHCEKSEERFTNFETYPQNEFENVEHLEMSANLLEKSQGLSVENVTIYLMIRTLWRIGSRNLSLKIHSNDKA